MAPLASTFARVPSIGAALAGLMLAAVVGTGCIVNDRDLPCRFDCQCPEEQICVNKTCSATTRTPPPEGAPGGQCRGGTQCDTDLVCYPDPCGESICRQRCSTLSTTSGCGSGEICEAVALHGDAGSGTGEGVCTP